MNNAGKTSERVLHLVVPAKAEYLSLLRVVVASVAAQMGFSNESIADIKVALSEASTNVVRHAYAEPCPPEDKVILIDCFEDGNRFLVQVQDKGCGIPILPPASEGLGLGIMSSLMDKVDVETGDSGTTVILEKKPRVTHR